ncbi:hypothetical protein D1O30_20240 [Methylocystis hirsuta]|uniref:Uncharacterized protein n=2 Tax=Methylocystis hirsuta TaxID=369798 RepID=A0A3M9XIY9_9HYPH|nr:hypothetical protein D1O30_20240 [Methylocystis hirsuta]
MLYDRRMLVFSLFPAIFSFHQFTEGMVWLSLSGAVDGKFYSYAYIFVAVLVWPILTPLASALAETDPDMKRHRYAFFGAALVVLGYLVFKLVNASGLDVKVVDHSLSYVIKYDTEPPAYAEYVYAAATLLPLLTLSNSALRLIGVLVGATFLYAVMEKEEVWFSAWCLSAAIFSTLLFLAIKGPEDASVVAAAASKPTWEPP